MRRGYLIWDLGNSEPCVLKGNTYLGYKRNWQMFVSTNWKVCWAYKEVLVYETTDCLCYPRVTVFRKQLFYWGIELMGTLGSTSLILLDKLFPDKNTHPGKFSALLSDRQHWFFLFCRYMQIWEIAAYGLSVFCYTHLVKYNNHQHKKMTCSCILILANCI